MVDSKVATVVAVVRAALDELAMPFEQVVPHLLEAAVVLGMVVACDLEYPSDD